jgi:membrane associated rhomboid family serine protease
MRPGYRAGGGMGIGGFGITPTVKILLIVNVAVFALQILFPAINNWGVYSTGTGILGLQIWRFITYMFMHGSLAHIGFNMLGLWIFGTQLEALWGRRVFLTYYFVCGLGGAILYSIMDFAGIGGGGAMLGASGAIYGLLLAYGLTFPDNVLLIGLIIPIKAKYAVILFGLIELFSTAPGRGGSGVAHFAHLGGMLTGFLFILMTMPGMVRRLKGGFSGGGGGGSGGSDLAGIWRRFQTKRKIRVVRPDHKTGPGNGDGTSGGSGESETPAEQKQIDLILDKISREGLQSLTDEEQDILRRAGRR